MSSNRRDDDLAYGEYHGQGGDGDESGERGLIGDMGRRFFGGNKPQASRLPCYPLCCSSPTALIFSSPAIPSLFTSFYFLHFPPPRFSFCPPLLTYTSRANSRALHPIRAACRSCSTRFTRPSTKSDPTSRINSPIKMINLKDNNRSNRVATLDRDSLRHSPGKNTIHNIAS